MISSPSPCSDNTAIVLPASASPLRAGVALASKTFKSRKT